MRSWIRKEGVYSRASHKQDLSQVSKLTLNHASATCPSNCMRETALEPHYNLEEDLRQIPAEGYPVRYLISAVLFSIVKVILWENLRNDHNQEGCATLKGFLEQGKTLRGIKLAASI